MEALYLRHKAGRALFFCLVVTSLVATGLAASPKAFGQGPVVENPDSNQSPGVDQRSLRLTPEQALSVVSQLIVAGELDQALSVLTQIQGRSGDPGQEKFLAAQIAIRKQQYAQALSIYDDLLEENPNLIRIRIERARLLVAMGDASRARTEFAEIRKGDLSDGLSGYVDRLIAATRQRQPWTFSFVASALYDSNASAGPDQDTVTLFGLPFTLSPDAQERAAWGANVSATGSYRWSLSEEWDIRAVGGISHTDVEQDRFDDSLVTGQVTLARSSSDASLTFGPIAYRRWFGGSELSTAWGGQGIAAYSLNSRWQISSVISVQDVSYDLLDDRDGIVASATLRATHSRSPSSAFYVYGGLAHEDSAARPLRNTIYRFGAAYAYRWSSGFQATMRPEVALRDFEGLQPAFAAKRRDWRLSAGVDIKAPHIAGTGLAPFVSYSFVKNDSSIDFNSYTRHQVRLGVEFEL